MYEESELQTTESDSAAPATSPANRGRMLGGAGVVVIGLVFLLTRHRNVATAVAAEPAASVGMELARFLQSPEANADDIRKAAADAEKSMMAFAGYPGANQVPLASLRRDPFAEAAPPTPKAMTVGREQQRLKVLAAVQQLQLGSILFGETRRACLINNTLFLEGQKVEGFLIEKITSASVIVRQDEYRFELRMRR